MLVLQEVDMQKDNCCFRKGAEKDFVERKKLYLPKNETSWRSTKQICLLFRRHIKILVLPFWGFSILRFYILFQIIYSLKNFSFVHDREQKSVSQIILKTFQQKHSFNPLMGQVLSLKEECCASLALTKSSRFDFYILYLILQAPAYEEDGETIGMTTNSDVSSHKPTKESPIFI